MASEDEPVMRARVPADVERPDEIVFGLTARHTALLAAVAVGLWLAYLATRPFLPFGAFVAVAVPVAGVAFAVVAARRDGLSLDRLLAAAWRHYRAPKRLAPGGEPVREVPGWVGADPGRLPAPLRLPAHAIGGDGVVDLGAQGACRLVACSTVNFSLRTPGEQTALIGGFARWLHSLTGPVQILVRADRVDLDPLIDTLETGAGGLPHPALEDACHAHATFLAGLAASRDLLRRRVTLVLHDPTPAAKAGTGLARRAVEATRGLAASEITVAPLDHAGAHAVVAAAADPHGQPTTQRHTTTGEPVTATSGLTTALTDASRPREE
ncbi:PrgI family protein [Saccharopolyspora sp. NPDC003752]